MVKIAPSILSADFGKLNNEIKDIESADLVHLDVMDGHFVPNVTIGIPVIRAIRKTTDLILDVHLMVTNAEASFEWYVDAGADYLSVHYEAVSHLDRATTGRTCQAGAQSARPGRLRYRSDGERRFRIRFNRRGQFGRTNPVARRHRAVQAQHTTGKRVRVGRSFR